MESRLGTASFVFVVVSKRKALLSWGKEGGEDEGGSELNSDDAERKFRIVCLGFDSVDVFFSGRSSLFSVESGGSKSNNDDATA